MPRLLISQLTAAAVRVGTSAAFPPRATARQVVAGRAARIAGAAPDAAPRVASPRHAGGRAGCRASTQ